MVNMINIPIEVRAAARQLGITRQTLHYHIVKRRLPVIRLGRFRIIEAQAWEQFKRDYATGKFDGRLSR
jgi:hypothetical protein